MQKSGFSLVKLHGLLLISFVITACSGGGGGGGGGNGGTTPNNNDSYVTFETGQVRPLALSSDGNTLYATNTPNGTLEVFDTGNANLTHNATIPVGMEPTAVATINNQVWVVNHLSDSVSVIDVSVAPAKVIRTLLVGDEPRDIVFANQFAFITTAHRGQNGATDSPVDAQLTTPAVGRADVWVFDTNNLGASLGGDPVTVITLFGDTPRALAVSPDGNTVYAAVFLSGNRTTTIGENELAKPAPFLSFDNILQPETGLILKFNGANWADGTGSIIDGLGSSWDSRVNLSLPDYDVFEIDASVNPPVANGTRYSGVGTVLFNMVTHPLSGNIYVSNTEALNEVRFEGPGGGGSTVRGHFVESRISVISSGSVLPRHLNKHINHNICCANNDTEKAAALAQPMDMSINSDGSRLYVAAFGSQKIGFFNTVTLQDNTFTPNAANQIMLSAGGPSGVVIDDQVHNQLYVLTRFDNGLSVIDINSGALTENQEVFHTTMFNPEPAKVIAGRQFLYDANATSSHGDSSCGLCHVFGDFDGLAWDLGNPDEVVVANNNPFATAVFMGFPVPLRPTDPVFHPMKGPMATQSLRGLEGNGPMHWRGDRMGEAALPGESVELGAFKDFNVAFEGLVGNSTQLSTADMQAFAEFALEITYPPNPLRALDNSLTTDQAAGRNIYLSEFTTGGGVLRCNDCHVLNVAEGHFGTSGLSSIEGDDISQQFKIPHLRNMYQKVGKFGVSGRFAPMSPAMGDQIRGFGFMHDGGMDTLDHFLQGSVFEFDPTSAINDQKRGQVVDFVMAMDSEMAPIVGQQITLTVSSAATVSSRIDLLRARAQVSSPAECDLIVKGVIANELRGGVMLANGNYQMDRQSEVMTDSDLRALVNVNNQTLTFTCVPPGSGSWMGIDRDLDGSFDRDELDAGTDPLLPSS